MRPNRLDQAIDDRRQALHLPSEDAGLPFLEHPPDPDEEDHMALLVRPPPQADPLLRLDYAPDPVLLHGPLDSPDKRGIRFLLLLEAGDQPLSPVSDGVTVDPGSSGKGGRFREGHAISKEKRHSAKF